MSSLRLEGIARTYGARPVLEGVSLGVEAGRVTALVGENGAGKSTLLKIAAGLVGPDRGEVRVDDMGAAHGRPARGTDRGHRRRAPALHAWGLMCAQSHPDAGGWTKDQPDQP